MSCFTVEIIQPSGKIFEVNNGCTTNIELSQCIAQLPPDFRDQIFSVVSGDIVAATGININSSGNKLYISSLINAGSGISLSHNSGIYSIAVTGNFGLTSEQVDDRVASLLNAGSNIVLNYDDFANTLTVSTSGLQPSGNYSLVGHTHNVSNIIDFNSSVSGLLPTIANSGDNRILTSTGSSVGINAESNLTFNGSSLVVAGDATVDNLKLDGNILSSTSGNIIISPSGNGALQRDSGGNARGQYAVDWQGVRSTGTMVAGGSYSTVGGGINNTSSGSASTVGGGRDNTSSGFASTVGGGFENTSSATGSTVGGGRDNTSSVGHSTVGGGRLNTSSGYSSTVGGGYANTSSGEYSIVGGGRQNNNSGHDGTIAGGYLNTNTGERGTVGGGYANNNSGSSSTISGGRANTVSNEYSTIAGGFGNTSSGYGSTIGGGNTNFSTGNRSTIGGGNDNTSSAYCSTIGGGAYGSSSATGSTVSGGRLNTSSAYYSTVGGGQYNTSSGNYSTIPGGFRGKATRYGELAHSAGRFSQDGDAQHTILISRRLTTNATANVVLTLNGDTPSSTNRLTLPSQTAWSFGIKVSAYNSTDNEGAWWIIRGGIRRNNSNSTTLVGSLITESGTESSLSSASVSVVANDTNEALEIRVTGVSGKTIRWVAITDISQVSFGTP